MREHSTTGQVDYKSLGFMGCSRYRVGTDGSGWSCTYGKWKQLKPRVVNKYGHTQFALYDDQGSRKDFGVGYLILIAFVGEPASKRMEVGHKDGDPANNHLSNLEWRTCSDGRAHLKTSVEVTVEKEVPLVFRSGEQAQSKLIGLYGVKEVWRDVKDYEGFYQVSNWGRVKSLRRQRSHMGGVYTIPERILRQGKVAPGHYVSMELYKDGGVRGCNVHQLVLEAFVGPCPEGMQGCHNDGNPANNRLENLRWDTCRSNQLDRVKHGTVSRGEKNANAKATKEQAMKIKELWATEDYTYSQIAKMVDLPKSTVSNIVRGKVWKWC